MQECSADTWPSTCVCMHAHRSALSALLLPPPPPLLAASAGMSMQIELGEEIAVASSTKAEAGQVKRQRSR